MKELIDKILEMMNHLNKEYQDKEFILETLENTLEDLNFREFQHKLHKAYNRRITK